MRTLSEIDDRWVWANVCCTVADELVNDAVYLSFDLLINLAHFTPQNTCSLQHCNAVCNAVLYGARHVVITYPRSSTLLAPSSGYNSFFY